MCPKTNDSREHNVHLTLTSCKTHTHTQTRQEIQIKSMDTDHSGTHDYHAVMFLKAGTNPHTETEHKQTDKPRDTQKDTHKERQVDKHTAYRQGSR